MHFPDWKTYSHITRVSIPYIVFKHIVSTHSSYMYFRETHSSAPWPRRRHRVDTYPYIESLSRFNWLSCEGLEPMPAMVLLVEYGG